jgi:hypothetical protein
VRRRSACRREKSLIASLRAWLLTVPGLRWPQRQGQQPLSPWSQHAAPAQRSTGRGERGVVAAARGQAPLRCKAARAGQRPANPPRWGLRLRRGAGQVA